MDDEHSTAIERAWQQYREAFVPPCLSPNGVTVLRDAFFNGANILFKAMTQTAAADDSTDEEVTAIWDRIDGELKAFGLDFERRTIGTKH